MPDDPSPGTAITLVIPAANDHIRFARLMASAVAARCGFDYDTIENLRLAVSELCSAVAEMGTGGELTLTYVGDVDAIRVAGHAPHDPARGSPPPEPPGELTSQVLEAVADEHTLELGPSGARFTLLLRARSATT